MSLSVNYKLDHPLFRQRECLSLMAVKWLLLLNVLVCLRDWMKNS